MKKYFTTRMLTLYGTTVVVGALLLWLIDKPFFIAIDFFVLGMFFITSWDKQIAVPIYAVETPFDGR